MEKNNLQVCVITFPFANTFVTPLSNLTQILSASTERVIAITGGDLTYNICQDNSNITHHHILYQKRNTIWQRIVNYLYLQIKLISILFKLSKKVQIYIFFMQNGAFVPMLFLKICRKNIIWALPSSLQKMRPHKTLITSFLVSLNKLNRIFPCIFVLYSMRLIDEWQLKGIRTKVMLGHEHFLDKRKFSIIQDFSERDLKIGYIGRLSKEKGICHFVYSIPEILKNNPDIHFLIGGDGPMLEKITEYIKKRNLQSHVTITGWIPDDKLHEYLNQLKLFVLPSYTEGLPIIMIEAMGCGTPVLATAVGAIPDIIINGVNGFILPDNSPSCLAKTILKTITNNLDKNISENAYTSISSEFSFAHEVLMWENIINTICPRK